MQLTFGRILTTYRTKLLHEKRFHVIMDIIKSMRVFGLSSQLIIYIVNPFSYNSKR